YNSVIFTSLSANNYIAVLVAQDFLSGGPWTTKHDLLGEDVAVVGNLQRNISSLKRLDNTECKQTYGTSFISTYRNLLLVSEAYNNTDSVIDIYEAYGIYNNNNYLCSGSGDCDISKAVQDAATWTIKSCSPNSNRQGSRETCTPFNVDYCLAEASSPICTVSLSRPLLVVVIVCNAIKLICLASTLALTSFEPLITVGDAIASFISDPDPTTVNQVWTAPLVLLGLNNTNGKPMALSELWAQGFGTVSTGFIITATIALPLTANVIVANTPQLLISFVAVFYNGLLTCMLLSSEANDFARRRKTLRVSRPRGPQRSTYWLQLPYRYAVPLLVAMGALHWLVSQSIFLARVNIYDKYGHLAPTATSNAYLKPQNSLSSCGWSPKAIIFALILGGAIILTLYLLGFRKYDAGMPVVGSCSAAISAACHRLDEGPEVAELPLKYGVLGAGSDSVDRAGFAAGEVRRLAAGKNGLD
ncbi:MAG: hypothetical protein Q9187_001037, partial [Circinaria calcarea]